MTFNKFTSIFHIKQLKNHLSFTSLPTPLVNDLTHTLLFNDFLFEKKGVKSITEPFQILASTLLFFFPQNFKTKLFPPFRVHRKTKMDITTPKSCPYTVTVRRNPPRRARATPLITPFPNEEMIPQQPSQNPTSTSENNENLKNPSENENLKVFLRIRPSQVQPPNQAPRVRTKTAWPKTQTKTITTANNSKKKSSSSSSCISINDSESVTLLVPSDLQDAKRVKSETYGGFTHVFPSDSSQVIMITVIFRYRWYFL